ncbi:hypothetical protein PENSUB_13180 [Penicillium subrubescens]|uniref:Uncharacterized protein n=1 Tax=Penicillium subrubescens TaxID=1316194 RepID=A0A1Q5SSA6_9EURO|nr:hypothetical protein PENSUB_13180 [Penicillium subrubescens]
MSDNHEPIHTDFQEHLAWEKIGAGIIDGEENAVLNIIYEVFALVVSHIQKIGKTQDISVDGAVQFMLKSKTQRDSLRTAFVAPKFFSRLPAKVQVSKKLVLKQEMYRLLERYQKLFKKTYLEYGLSQPQAPSNAGFDYHRATVIPNADVQANIIDRSPEGDWINGPSISPAQFTVLQQHLHDEGVLEDGDSMWLCPMPMQELNVKKIESPQPGESRLINFNIAPVVDRIMSKHYPKLRCSSPEFLKGEMPLARPSLTIIIRSDSGTRGNLLPTSRQPDLLHPGAPVYVPEEGPEVLSRRGPAYRFCRRRSQLAWSIQYLGQSTDETSKTSGPGGSQVGELGVLVNVRHHPYGRPASVTRVYNPFSPDGHRQKRLRVAMESPMPRSDSDSDISLGDVSMES